MNAALAAAPMLRDCISAVTPCPGQNAFIETNAIAPIDPANFSSSDRFAGTAAHDKQSRLEAASQQEQFRFHANQSQSLCSR